MKYVERKIAVMLIPGWLGWIVRAGASNSEDVYLGYIR